jgi:hypothetical protein
MIRIDEIYNNTFWPWVNKHINGTRLFYCDPPGRSDPDALFNFGTEDIPENNFIFLHDQEPIHFDLHKPLFDDVKLRTNDITQDGNNTIKGHVIVSEKGEFVDELTRIYGWKSHYYFYHGWACKDWFRGYDKTFLIPRARDRAPTKTFHSPNRIIAGKRDHRVLFLYNVFRHGLENNWISAPRVCAYEKVDISVIASKYNNIYPDIEQVFNNAKLPILFPGEDEQYMTSCWLTNFDEAADSLVYVPTETVYFGQRLHITEKTFKAIALEMPFVLVAPAGSLEYMRSYGFQTFDGIFDESYDLETDDIKRVEKVTKLLKDLDNLSVKERQQIHRACMPIVEHNFEHFYGPGLEKILWTELMEMFRGLEV